MFKWLHIECGKRSFKRRHAAAYTLEIWFEARHDTPYKLLAMQDTRNHQVVANWGSVEADPMLNFIFTHERANYRV